MPGEETAAVPERRQARRLRRWLPRAAMLAAVAAATTGCKSTTFTRLGMPVPVTQQGKTVVDLWQGSWIAAFAVGFLVWGLILWAVIFPRKRADLAAPSGALQPPDRDPLHGRAVHHGRGHVLLHGTRRE